MPDLRWTEGPVHCTDLVDGTGKVFGYVGPCAAGMRGYVVQSGSEWPPRPAAFADHPAADAARAWVEAEVSARAFRPVRIIRETGAPVS
ncbi:MULTISPECIES: hypothetical protein [Methylobacterium]|jgi:hypothetical protein|uniref:Uncharacterized protein n=2 Tax=Methylobacterium TaxID=407 RepID=A0AAE8HUY1_9HYPH|nr:MULTISPECIES: hypothetical protein [Methylobacterium]KOX49659.1 hypothetical protein ADL19_20165 [Streptomyces purpurogeneiscleroticus]AIQ89139.1 protein of unassigned function [Methylobacterium oryzae CBMB20]APT30044.1 hypothetical protein MCBMB27_00753 [Methylobacterium phyllosphaerae]AWV18339.1 hypothetical protein A3862_24805 [Methylobacterium sp. XJLW]MBP30127.1 hypothetical protein [Methylobacterium sp.]